jgi:xyloglucan-specific exo-beta-1,4-glucanase
MKMGYVFVVLDPASVSGGKTQTIYAGVSQVGASNLYKSIDGGISWTAVSGATTSYMPQRAVLDSNRSLLITYADLEGPWNGTQGKISKLSSTGIFTDITPAGITRPFGGIDVDPANPQRLIASTTNTWSFQYTTPGGTAVYGDHFYVSTDGGTNWRDLVGNSGFSFETNGCTWVSGQSIHWATDFKFNPTNTSQASIVSGNGLFTCDDINAVKTTWKFDAIGIEESVPLDLISIPSGPLMSVIGDFDGFKHTDVTVFAPQHAPTMGTSTSISYATGNTNKIVRLGEFMYYSGNQGATWTKTTAPLMGQKGRAALSYDGNTILHCPSGATSIYRSVDNGTTWTTCNGISVSDAIPFSDQVTNNKFYVYDQPTGLMMISTDGGVNFVSGGNVGSGGSKLIRTVPGNAGHIWIAMNGGGLKRSIDGGLTFVVPSANVTAASAVGIGKASPGKTYPSIYIWGTVNGVTGVFRSIDEGVAWLRVNDDAYEFGGTGNGNFVIGDMNTFGRVYMSTVGRGIVYTGSDANLGISDNEFKNDTQIFSVKAHPNPMKDYVVLELPDYTNGTLVNIQVYDLLVKLIKQDMYTVSNNTVTLFSNDLSNQHGILLVKVKTSNGKSGIVKIIK